MRFEGLWRHPDFLKLWAGQTVSVFGSLITHATLPFIAALMLDASPLQMAALAASGMVPSVLVAMHVGVWVDRLRRRPVMVAADLLRARGFRVAVVGDHPYPGVPAGVILRQNPQAGFQIAPGEAISIEVSR